MSAERPALVVLVPIAPAPTGNGLAMRMWSLVSAAGVHHDVVLFVVPVAGSSGIDAPAPPGVVARDDVVGDQRVDGVLACQLGVAELGVSLADRYDVPLIIDVADDDVALHRSRGELEAAEAAERIAVDCFARARLVTVASHLDAESISRRYDLGDRVAVAPNSVAVPDASALTEPQGSGRVLFVGNFSYPPNIEGATWLVTEVLPHLDPDVTIDVVGRTTEDVEALADDRARVWGAVDDVAPFFASADVVVAPLWSGSGTRIKILEAFAHRRPVVSTTIGAAGIDAVDGIHLRISDDAKDFARAISELREPEAAAPLVAAAHTLVSTEYDERVVRDRIASMIAHALGSDDRPETIAGLDINESPDGLIVFDAQSNQVHQLNPSASVVFSLCTGANTVADIAAELRTLFDLAEPPTAEVLQCLTDLAALQLLR